MTKDDLLKLGYLEQPDGSYSKVPAPVHNSHQSRKLPDPVPQHSAQQALVALAQGKGKGGKRITISINRRSTRTLDLDNFAGGCKPLIDQLRYAQLIPDDDPASVEIIFTQEKVPHQNKQGTSLKIVYH
jgi:hypothetical protein